MVYRDVVRDNILVNVSGKRRHAMPVDLNMEHGIRAAKVCTFCQFVCAI
jgi:hypothetical protein